MSSGKWLGAWSLALAWILLGATAQAAHADDAYAWLKKVQQATRTQSFSGTLLYLQGKHSEALKVARLNQDGNIREKMYSLTGSYREVVRNNDQIWCYFPDKQLGIADIKNAATSAFPGFLPGNIEELKQHYDFKLGDTLRLAGRECQEIDIVPRDQYRYGYRLYADKATALLLGADMVDVSGGKLESYMFTDIHIGDDISEQALAPSKPKKSMVWRVENPDAESVVATPPLPHPVHWEIETRPDGFRLTGSALSKNSDDHEAPVEQLVYSDGLATVSVFIRKLPSTHQSTLTPPKSLRNMGAINALGMVVRGHQVTVVGEVPAPTLELMGASLNESATR